MKRILIVIAILVVFSMMVFAQPQNLTDRELLIQLYGKVESIQNTVDKLADNTGLVKTAVNLLDKRVTTNETSIGNFYEKLSELVSRWNTLLGLFITFILGMFLWMWKRTYNGHPKRG